MALASPVSSSKRLWWEDHLQRESDWEWCWRDYWWRRDAMEANR